ncbi:MAG: hypothetical protein V1824_01115, partial [archaeon]
YFNCAFTKESYEKNLEIYKLNSRQMLGDIQSIKLIDGKDIIVVGKLGAWINSMPSNSFYVNPSHLVISITIENKTNEDILGLFVDNLKIYSESTENIVDTSNIKLKVIGNNCGNNNSTELITTEDVLKNCKLYFDITNLSDYDLVVGNEMYAKFKLHAIGYYLDTEYITESTKVVNAQ